MRKERLYLAVFLVSSMVTGVVTAQAPEGPPQPGPEHQRLARFVGKWTGKAEMKPSPFGPGGPMTWTEDCAWFPGSFAVVCNSDGKGPLGPMKGIGISGYNAGEQAYVFMGTDNTGWMGNARGKVEGKTWTYTSTEKVGDKTFQGRMIMEEISDRSHSFKYEMSEDGKTWTVVMEGSASK